MVYFAIPYGYSLLPLAGDEEHSIVEYIGYVMPVMLIVASGEQPAHGVQNL